MAKKKKNEAPQPSADRNPANFYLRALVDTFYAVQVHRIKAGNRIGAYVKLGVSEEQSASLHKFIDDRLKETEDGIGKLIEREVQKEALWLQWLLGVKGIGPKLAGSLVARIAPFSKIDEAGKRVPRFRTISCLWRQAGQAVFSGEAEKPVKGEKLHYDPVLKTTCWKIGEQFVKQGSLYRDLYDQFKSKLQEQHPKPIDTGRKNKKGEAIFDFSPAHIHRMAKRKAVKMFLSHLWLKWCEIEGLAANEPYAIAIQGHSGFVGPEGKI